MSIQFEHSLEIARPPEDVFATIEDFSETPKWLSNCAGIEVLSGGPLAAGSRIRFEFRDPNHTGTMEGQITERVLNQRLAFECADQTVGVVADFVLSPTPRGTRLTHSIEVQPKTFLVSMFSPLIRGQLPKQTIAAMEKLRNVLESSQA